MDLIQMVAVVNHLVALSSRLAYFLRDIYRIFSRKGAEEEEPRISRIFTKRHLSEF